MGLRRRTPNLARLLAGNAVLGLIPAVALVVSAGANWHTVCEWAICGLVYANLIGTLCWIVRPRVQAAMDGRPLWLQIAAVGGVFAGAGLAGSVAGNVVLYFFDLAPDPWFSVRVSLAVTFSFGVLSFVITGLAARLNDARRETEQRRIAEQHALKMAAEARYASLESRVQPHFLFNTLNSIAALVRENPAEAERMIERLSALLRYSLDSDRAEVVPLGEELRVVVEYLEIERVRFGPRLRYRIDVDEGARAFRVPALSIQTLVENSVKYAIGPRREGGEIGVTARVSNGELRIEVSDDGPGFEPAASLKPGHGLELVRNRLESIFGSAASLEIASRDGLMLVAFSVPA